MINYYIMSEFIDCDKNITCIGFPNTYMLIRYRSIWSWSICSWSVWSWWFWFACWTPSRWKSIRSLMCIFVEHFKGIFQIFSYACENLRQTKTDKTHLVLGLHFWMIFSLLMNDVNNIFIIHFNIWNTCRYL